MSILQGNAKQGSTRGFYSFPLEQSLRFNDDDSAYLEWTPASAGDRKTWTWSGWVKRCNIGSGQTLFSCHTGGSTALAFQFLFDSGDNLNINGYTTTFRDTTAVYRDPSAWYHIVLAVDTTQATASDRIKIYVNGEQVTSFATSNDYSASADTGINQASRHTIGAYDNGLGDKLDGYMAEVNFIDGTALDATSFGETKSGVWIPKAYSGSYGTNGFRLKFAGNANDSSGNGNNWTANNISSHDYVPDSPTNNFATLNFLGTNDISSFSQGNLKITTGSGASSSGATMGMSSGKWYAEFVCTAKTSVNFGFGITKANTFDGDNQLDEGTNVGYFWVNNATIYHGFASDSYGATVSTGDVVGIAFDADTLALQFYKNGVGQGNYTRVASENTAGDHWIFGCGEGQASATATFVANFGQDSSFVGNKTAQGNSDENGYGDFYYTPPSGYLALCTANLPVAEAVDPALDNSPQDYFDVDIYTGTGASHERSEFTFQPDMLWGKSRSNAYNHLLIDSVRGTDKGLFPDVTNAESTNTLYLSSFDSDGYTLGPLANFNGSGSTYVMWAWKANGTGVSNNVGSIPSTVSANTESGFSVGTFVGNQTAGATVGHGLSQAPEFVIVKPRNQAENWNVQTDGKRLNLNSTGSASTNYLMTFNSDTVTLTDLTYQNGNGYSMLMYAFHSVEGFSKFGSYTGNGSTDGPFVYTGFRPAFVMMKDTNDINTWAMYDAERNINNVVVKGLKPNSSEAEYTSSATNDSLDFVSNGFKIRGTGGVVNASGHAYIYMAFAENPFKYSNAR